MRTKKGTPAFLYSSKDFVRNEKNGMMTTNKSTKDHPEDLLGCVQ